MFATLEFDSLRASFGDWNCDCELYALIRQPGDRFRPIASYTIEFFHLRFRISKMPKTYLLSADSDPVGKAVAALLAGTAGFEVVSPAELSNAELGSGDVLLADDSAFDSDIDFTAIAHGMVQFLHCSPSPELVARLIEVGATVAGISPVIAPRVANRAVGFGGPLRVKPDAQWGVIGLGEVGSEVVRKLAPSEATAVIAEVRTPRSGLLAEFSVRRLSLDLLVAGSDAASLHVHRGPTASPLISERELNLMIDGAALINTSHASIVDEEAVLASLADGPLGGYATDCPGETLANLDEVLRESLVSSGKLFVTTNPLTNQVGAAQQIAKFVATNIEAFADGSGVKGIIDPIDFPKIGDPSFWASRMSPRQG